MTDTLTEYTWVFVLAIIFSFAGAFGIGANDVANAFATSVGAKSITVKQAAVAATIFEFSGAFFMGSHVAKTIRKGICDLDLFQQNDNDPEILMFGMMCVTFSTAVWLLAATYYSLPVSTTHTCVGSVMGVAIAAKGWDAVNWNVVGKIVLSWFASPILSGLFAIGIYMIIKHGIMYAEDPQARTLLFYPILVAFCVIIVTFYTIYKGTPQLGLKETPLGTACGVAFGVGAFAFLLTQFLVVPKLRNMMANTSAVSWDEVVGTKAKEQDIELQKCNDENHQDPRFNEIGGDDIVRDGTEDNAFEENLARRASQEDASQMTGSVSAYKKFNDMTDKVVVDIDKRFQDTASDQVLEMLANAEKHDARAELALSYLQVFSACFDAFAHGANDVANSIGPMAAVYAIWESGAVEKKNEMPLWILGLGGVGIVTGLLLYGYKIMQAIGFELTKLSPSRGFSIELGAALVVLTGSRLEIPLSTTHCQVGATVGVGLTEGVSNVNWSLFGKVVAGWIFTLVIASLLTAAVFSYAVYSPQAV